MTAEDLKQKVREIVGFSVGMKAERITDQSRLVEGLGFDSLDTFEAVMRIEDAFGIHIDDAEVRQLLTFGDVADMVASKVKEKRQ